MARISTHVLDLVSGKPAAGMKVELRSGGNVVASAITNSDGRTDGPLVSGDTIPTGNYELAFQVGDYFQTPGVRFLGEVTIKFGVSDAQGNYHVPLLVTPHAYSTYRGS